MENEINNLGQNFLVPFTYEVLFTRAVFNKSNELLFKSLIPSKAGITKILIMVDSGLIDHNSSLLPKIEDYFRDRVGFKMVDRPILIPGGEECKNDFNLVFELLKTINLFAIDRHSYIIGVGGGAVLDLVGFVSSIAHRGIRHIRIPSTVLSQNDSGVGVKNGVNLFGKKNFVGCFSPPELVINDVEFLRTLHMRDWLSGLAEAVKVALIKDYEFFCYLENNASGLVKRAEKPMEYVINRCAELHLEHIASGDPFEKGSSRPLDFGHWSAHKLEQLSGFEIKHGEAVSIGIALDSVYSCLIGRLDLHKRDRVLNLLLKLELPIFCREILIKKESNELEVFDGLIEFQEHIGGELTIMMLEDIGKGKEINTINYSKMEKAILDLESINNYARINEHSEII